MGAGTGGVAGQEASQDRPPFGAASAMFSSRSGSFDPQAPQSSDTDFRSGAADTQASSSTGGGVEAALLLVAQKLVNVIDGNPANRRQHA